MECGHSAVRELTKLRGKGHVPSLVEVSAKSICRFVSKHHHHIESKSEMPPDDAQEGPQNEPQPQKNKTDRSKKQKNRSGGGSAWNAFCAERCPGVKFTRQILRALSQEFRALSVEEFNRLKEAGRMLTIQNRHKRLMASSGSNQTIQGADGAVVPAAALDICSQVIASPNPAFFLEGEDLSGRFESFKKHLNLEQKARRQADEALRCPKDPTDPASNDQLLSSQLIRAGGKGLLAGLRRSPIGSGPAALAVDHFRWKLPLIPVLRAALNDAARFEDELRVADLENDWARLHELVQHDKQEPLTFGKNATFPVKACAKLATCVCSENGKAAAVMWHKLKTYLKKMHPGTHKKSTPERDRFVAKLCVLELCSLELGLEQPLPPQQIEDDSTQGAHLFLHCGYTNFTTWETAGTRLHICHYNPLNGYPAAITVTKSGL